LQDQIKATFRIPKHASNGEKLAKNILSGGFAGSLSLLVVQSIDYTRTRLAVDAAKNSSGQRQFNGIVDCYVKTFKADGIRGLYRGFGVSCLCIFIYRGLYFGLYDSLKPVVLDSDSGWLQHFLLGWGVTITAGLCAYPVDTVKRRMMMTSAAKDASVVYKSSLACVKSVVAAEGWRALFRGAGVNVIRGVAGAGVLSGFDKFKSVYVGWRVQHQKLA